MAAAAARVTALESELRAKDAALRASRAQDHIVLHIFMIHYITYVYIILNYIMFHDYIIPLYDILQGSQWSAGCASLRRQLEAVELRAAQAGDERAAAEEAVRVLRSELGRAAAAVAAAERRAAEAEQRAGELTSFLDTQDMTQEVALRSACAAAAGRVAARAAGRLQAESLGCLLLLLWRSWAMLAQEAAFARAASAAADQASAARPAVVRLLGGAVGRFWRARRQLVLEAWRLQYNTIYHNIP